MKLKWGPSFLITLVYNLFTILYTGYIIAHPGIMHGNREVVIYPRWGYFLGFLLVGNYLYLILQGLVLRSKNWGVLLLLPLGLFAATFIVGYSLVGLARLVGGRKLLDKDGVDMALTTGLLLIGAYFSLRLIRPGGRKINSKGKKR
jgi:hypothetical protein